MMEYPDATFSIIVRNMKNRHQDEILIREAVRFILTESVIDDPTLRDDESRLAEAVDRVGLKEIFFGKSTEPAS